MKTLSKVNKSFVLFAALSLILSLVLPFQPVHTYADVNSNPICTITADNLTPSISSTITENFTATFNSGLSSNMLHKWALYSTLQRPSDPYHSPTLTYFTQVINSTDFPFGLSLFWEN